MEDKDKKSKNSKFNLKKFAKIFLVCALIFTFSVLHMRNAYINDYSIAVKADAAGDYQRAEVYYSQAINDTMGLNPYPLLGLGKLYSIEGKYSEAEPLITKALEISRRRYQPNDSRVVNATYALATLYSREGKHQDAELFFNETLKLIDVGNTKLKADILESLGSVYLSSKDYKKSEKYLLQSLTLKKKIYSENQLYLDGAYTDLGILYSATRKYNKSQQIFEKSLEFCESNGCNDDKIINLYINSIDLYLRKNDLKQAEFYANKAMNKYNNSTSFKNINTNILILKDLSLIQFVKGNESKALEILNKALSLSTISFGETSEQANQMKRIINRIKNKEIK